MQAGLAQQLAESLFEQPWPSSPVPWSFWGLLKQRELLGESRACPMGVSALPCCVFPIPQQAVLSLFTSLLLLPFPLYAESYQGRINSHWIAALYIIIRHIRLSGSGFVLSERCLSSKVPMVSFHLPWHCTHCAQGSDLECSGQCGVGPASHLGCCSCCCSNRTGIHGLWAEALSSGSCWAGRENEFFMIPQMTSRSIRVSQGK